MVAYIIFMVYHQFDSLHVLSYEFLRILISFF